MIAAETSGVGDIKWADYREFMSYSSGACGIFILFMACLL